MAALPWGDSDQELHHAIRVRVGERLEQYRIDNSENRGVDADAQRQGSDGGEGESRICAEHAHCVFEVVPEIAHEPLHLLVQRCQPEVSC